jgi:hypothetical protein
MQNDTFSPKKNPLTMFMRQPKIYIKLPSRGKYWPGSSIDYPDNEELAVYSMTAKDELLFKTPDALMNGQAIVDVVQSCMPSIKNAWDIPTIDLDTILVAIRLATYGEKMPFSHKIPVINEEVDFELDLRTILDQQSQNTWINQIAISSDLVLFVKPLSYKHLTQTSVKTFETNRILAMVNDEKISDEEKLKLFNQSFNMLTKVTVELTAESVYKIVANGEDVTDPVFIKEFINNVDKDIFDKINKHLGKLKEQNDLKSLKFSTTAEQQAQGAPETYTIPINFNDSDFFARGF